MPDQLLRDEIASAPASRVVTLRVPGLSVLQAWELFADTELLNRALGSPELEVCNIPVRPGLSRRLLTTRPAPRVTYEEEHYQWERGRWIGGRRFFLEGPLERFLFLFSQRPDVSGAISEMRIGFWGRTDPEAAQQAATGLGRGLESLQERLLAVHLQRRPRLVPRACQPCDKVGLQVFASTLRDSGEAPATIEQLVRHLEEGSDQELEHMEPLALAAEWEQPPEQVVDAFIRAARLGLLLPRWSVACPNCRAPKGTHTDVAELARRAAHCEDCNISFDADPLQNMALTFTPAPDVRRLEPTYVCVAGPSRTPHVLAQAYAPPDSALLLAHGADFRPGLWLSSPTTGTALRLEETARFALAEEGPLRPLEASDGIQVENQTPERLRVRLEDRALPHTFLLATRVLERPRFRALFGADQWQFLSTMARAWQAEFGLATTTAPPSEAAGRWDLVVVGAGPGGEAAALGAAHRGKRVALVEGSAHFGGPTGLGSKAMREAVHQLVAWSGAGAHGRDFADPARRFARVRTLFEQRFGPLRRYVAALQMQEVLQRLARAGVSLHHGQARFEADGTLRVTPRTGEAPYRLSAEHCVLATGSRPARPATIPFDGARVLDAEEISALEVLPRTLGIVGAGVIGCEFATLMAALGVRVTLLTGGRPFFPFLDRELAEAGQEAMQRAGIQVLSAPVTRVQVEAGSVTVQLAEGGPLHCELVLFAEGRQANSEQLGCEQVQVQVGRFGRVEVDEAHRTSNPAIFAVGDLAGPPGLASAAAEQGRAVVDLLFRPEGRAPSHPSLTPTTIWTFPELAGVGLTENGAAATGVRVSVGRALYRDQPRGILSGDLHGWLKLIADAQDGRLLGVHIIGQDACELVHYGAALIEGRTTLEQLARSGFSAITFHGLYQAAAEDALALWPSTAGQLRGSAAQPGAGQ